MAQIINQYSSVVLAVLLLGILFVVFRRKPRKFIIIPAGILVLGSIIAWMFMRPVATLGMDAAERIRAEIGGGTPVLLEFQSPY